MRQFWPEGGQDEENVNNYACFSRENANLALGVSFSVLPKIGEIVLVKLIDSHGFEGAFDDDAKVAK